MKLVVLGASGGVGLEIVRQAIERGHHVAALVRTPEPLKTLGDRIGLIRGDLLNRTDLERVVHGQDAVLSAFGPRLPLSKADSDLLQRFATALTSAMLHAAVSRLVIVSTSFLFKDSIIDRKRVV